MNRDAVLALIVAALPGVSAAQVRVAVPQMKMGGVLPSMSYGAVLSRPTVNIGVVPNLGTPLTSVLPAFQPAVANLDIDAAPLSMTALPQPAVLEAEALTLQAAAPAEQAAAVPQTTFESLQGLAAEVAAPAKAGDNLSKAFDGASELVSDLGPDPSIPAEAETITRDVADIVPETMDLWLSGKGIVKPVVKSEIYGQLRAIRGKGSKRYWQKYKKGTPVRVLTGFRALFISKIKDHKFKKISSLVKKDLEGIMPKSQLRNKTIRQLRKMIVEDLREREMRSTRYGRSPSVITPETEVSVMRFMSYGDAKALPENNPDPVTTPRIRKPVSIPEQLAELHKYLPKMVVLDLRGQEKPLTFDAIEDIGKLMKAGVYFTILSEKPIQGPDSVEKLLTGGLTHRERSQVTRYKLFTLGLDGAELAGYSGSFPNYMRMPKFELMDIDVMRHVAGSMGGKVLQAFSKEMVISLPKKADPGKFMASFRKEVNKFAGKARNQSMAIETVQGKPALAVRAHTMRDAIPSLLASLRDVEGLYLGDTDIMLVSRQEDAIKALPESIQPGRYAPKLSHEDLMDMSLAAALGEYRENLPGDFAASASKIEGFKRDKFRLGGGNQYSVYMFLGHVIHASFNWAVWNYRNTGVFPDVEAMVDHAKSVWDGNEEGQSKNLLDKSGHSMADHRVTMELRTRTMHALVADLLKKYPIVIGTELPNLHVFNRYKKGELAARDILRTIYDFAVARETPKGLELLIVDFKTGQGATNQTFDRKTQVQLYDLVPDRAWQEVPVPFSVTGPMKKVSKIGVAFIFPNEIKEARLNEWTRVKYEKWLRNIVNRMRKFASPEAAKPAAKKAPAKKTAAPRDAQSSEASAGILPLKTAARKPAARKATTGKTARSSK